MSEPSVNNKNRCRAVFVSVSLLAALVAGSLVFAFVERIRDASDRAT